MNGLILDDPDGTLEMLRDSVVGFSARHAGPDVFRARRDNGGDLDREVWSAMAEAGWLGLLLPEDKGGAGLGIAEQAVLSEALGRALLTEPLAQLSIFSSVLLSHCSGGECARLAEGLIAGTALVSPAWQGRDGAAAPVSARKVGEEFSLSGEMRHVSAPTSATDFIVLAEADGKQMLVSLPVSAEGLRIETAPTLDGTRLGRLSLADVKVKEDALLAIGSEVDVAMDAAVTTTRLALAAEMAGIATAAIERTVAYAKERVQFGKAIGSFQVVQHRLVDMWGEAEFASAAVVNAVETLSEGQNNASRLAILAAKARAGEAAVNITRRAIHLHGAMGFTDACDIGLFMKRAVALNATLGQPEELRLQFVALEGVAA
ncbi:acyl-CoA dehydrogenase family protein [Rhizobium sp. L1K21]|uniref:acyl-CoA dehydrogenase family protein n=1 Tax=Rhizobium sp. L1K21 TaxID=2954933 RepID=UPI0020924724|nr:acyl-CoA dehydrogenase family protein [Rhizobium sp. L1K21]MCO6188483.1 acyl-CoA/acyl-ACP dehydrogenase [Rhizobium sp. L1K21]